jgi:transposase
LQPGDIVILDNLSSHKVSGAEEAIRATGATLLYLPPYSPDFNPIEKFFSKLKAPLAMQPNDPSTHYERKSATCSIPLRRASVQTSSPHADMYTLKSKMQ